MKMEKGLRRRVLLVGIFILGIMAAVAAVAGQSGPDLSGKWTAFTPAGVNGGVNAVTQNGNSIIIRHPNGQTTAATVTGCSSRRSLNQIELAPGPYFLKVERDGPVFGGYNLILSGGTAPLPPTEKKPAGWDSTKPSSNQFPGPGGTAGPGSGKADEKIITVPVDRSGGQQPGHCKEAIVDLTPAGGKKGSPRTITIAEAAAKIEKISFSIDDGSWIRLKSHGEDGYAPPKMSLAVALAEKVRTTAVVIVGNLDHAHLLPQGQTITRMTVQTTERDIDFEIKAGIHMSEWNGPVKHADAPTNIGDRRFMPVFWLPKPMTVTGLRFDYVEAPKEFDHGSDAPGFCLRGITLADCESTAPPEDSKPTQIWKCAGSNHTFEKREGKKWVEATDGKVNYEFEERTLTPNCLELFDASRNVTVQIYPDKALWSNIQSQGNLICDGSWQASNPPQSNQWYYQKRIIWVSEPTNGVPAAFIEELMEKYPQWKGNYLPLSLKSSSSMTNMIMLLSAAILGNRKINVKMDQAGYIAAVVMIGDQEIPVPPDKNVEDYVATLPFTEKPLDGQIKSVYASGESEAVWIYADIVSPKVEGWVKLQSPSSWITSNMFLLCCQAAALNHPVRLYTNDGKSIGNCYLGSK